MISSGKAVVGSVLCTIIVVSMVFCLYRKCAALWRRWRNRKINGSFRREEVETHQDFRKNVEAVIMDEDGIDVLYLRRLEDGELGTGFPKVVLNSGYAEDWPDEEKRVDGSVEGIKRTASREALLLQEPLDAAPVKKKLEDNTGISIPEQPLPPLPPSLPPMVPGSIPAKPTPPPPPPPPPLPSRRVAVLVRRTSPLPAPTPPPLPPRAAGLSALQLKPPPAPGGRQNSSRADHNSRSDGNGGTKLKPLHWDKIAPTNADHSVVWDEINDGSLRFDDELMETLFGYTNYRDRVSAGNGKNGVSTSSNKPASAPTSQVFIFEPRKSQNAAIVLKSITISRREIIEALLEGQGLSADTQEKLTKIAPTQEEASKIRQFDESNNKLAYAECFFYHILKAVPSAFTRLNAMLFRSNYDSDILQLKESLQTLELACKELRTRGLFLKLLEAILKAGNKMNAGTARGNAQGFNLSALGKLYDVKSTDGKTTLLHFVVKQVVRSEGRRCFINRTQTNLDLDCDTEDGQEKEFLSLGLQELGSLRTEFSNVRKAATIEYESLINTCSALSGCVAEIRNLVSSCDDIGERGGFLREMKQFLEGCDEELKVVGEEQTRVIELVKRTTDYYQVGASRDKGTNPLHLFVLIKDFLDMVDRVRADITQKLQKKKSTGAYSGLPPPLSSPARSPPRFLNDRLQPVKDILSPERHIPASQKKMMISDNLRHNF
ncbi:formin-like protein 4 [Punica granatum]|uniref:Formin-like protein n=1 Tax=Punica granatum TaxID=22663 RepID=A0A218VYL0_PUNGR|nr:formin-like protein 4 [Punica granatum]OWM65359.1 hypothetical protein CDL15_Pgr008949 [Punica granatum]